MSTQNRDHHDRAAPWDRERVVVAKAECHAAGTNFRFVVTSLTTATHEQASPRPIGRRR